MAKKGFSMNSMTDIFNNASIQEKDKKFNIKMIDIDEIELNDKNEYAISDIEELATSIGFVGIKQNLDVLPKGENGKYRLISGERRYTAVCYLVSKEGREDLRKVPCTITEPSKAIDLPIPDEIKELWLLTATNREQRNKTDADRLVDINNQKRIYQALIDAGVDLPGRKRDIIASALNISSAQVQRYEYVEKKLTPELKKAFDEDKIPLTVAVDAAKQSGEVQKALEKTVRKEGKLTQAAVDKAKEGEKKKEAKAEYDTYIISSKDLEFLKDGADLALKIKDGAVIKGKDYEKILAAKAIIEHHLDNIAKIIEKARKEYTL